MLGSENGRSLIESVSALLFRSRNTSYEKSGTIPHPLEEVTGPYWPDVLPRLAHLVGVAKNRALFVRVVRSDTDFAYVCTQGPLTELHIPGYEKPTQALTVQPVKDAPVAQDDADFITPEDTSPTAQSRVSYLTYLRLDTILAEQALLDARTKSSANGHKS